MSSTEQQLSAQIHAEPRGRHATPIMPPQVFISYSHRDRKWKDRLVRQLGVLEREDLLHAWHDGLIATGVDWLPEIESAMAEAGVAVLLVSADFLNSDFVRGQEVPTLLKRRQNEGMRIVPVIVNPCPWKKVKWLAPIQALPLDDKTLADLSTVKADRVLSSLAVEILELVQVGGPASGARPPELPAGLVRGQPKASERQPAPIVSDPATSEGPSRLPGTAPPRLHQLPAPPADFTGRAQELQELRAATLAGGATAIFGLHGMGGVGKTALALKLAEEVAGQYPDGQIYLDLKGVTTPLKPTQAMAWVVRSFLPEAPLPEDDAERAALYRSVLHGKLVLLLMDNAANREQIEPLRPPIGCALLVTSRSHFSFSGLRRALARELGDRRGEGNALANLGTAHYQLGEPRRAIELLEQALKIDREIVDRRGEGCSLGNMGIAHAALGDLHRAIDFFKQNLAISREIGDRRGESNALGNLGNAYVGLGEPHRAIELYERQLAISHEIGDCQGESIGLGNLGNAYAHLGEHQRAIELYEQQLDLGHATGDRWQVAHASWNLGVIFEQQGNLARAAELKQVLVNLERQLGHADADTYAADVAKIRARLAA